APAEDLRHEGTPEVSGAYEVLAPPGGRPGAVRPVPALLQAARGPARLLLRARLPGRRGRADHLRPLQRLLRRSDREEAAVPLPARHAGAVVRHGGMQFGL